MSGSAVVVLCIFLFIGELAMFIYLLKQIFKYHSLTLKDTIIYPLVLFTATIIVFVMNNNYVVNDTGNKIINNLRNGLSSGIDVIALQFDASLKELAQNNGKPAQLLYYTYVGVYLISFTALFSLTISLFKASVKNYFKLLFRFFRRENTILFGFNDDAKKFVMNLDPKSRRKVTVVLNSSILYKYTDEKLFLEKYGVAYRLKKYTTKDEIICTLNSLTKRKKTLFKSKKYNIASYLEKESENINFLIAAKEFLKTKGVHGGFYCLKPDSDSAGLYPIEKNQVVAISLKLENDYYIESFKVNGQEPLLFNNRQNMFLFRCKDEDNTVNYDISIKKCDKTENFISKKLYDVNEDWFKEPKFRSFKKLINKERREPLIKWSKKALEDLTQIKECNFYTVHYEDMRDISIVVNIDKDEQTLFEQLIVNPDNKDKNDRLYFDLNLNVTSLLDDSHGMIRMNNKYEIIANDFINKYSLANYLFIEKDNQNNERIIESFIENDCTLRDCDINLFVLGFGKVNQELLRDVLINNQFVKKDKKDDKYLLKPQRINVKVFDKNKKMENLDFASGFLKYNKDNYLKESKDCKKTMDYFDLPDNYLKAEDIIFDAEIGDKTFVQDLYNSIKSKNSRQQFNFFIISLDNDAYNWDVANKLNNDLSAIDNCKNIFFVRTKEYQDAYESTKYFNEKNMFPFGFEYINNLNALKEQKNIALSHDNIITDKTLYLSKMTHYLYSNRDIVFNDNVLMDKALSHNWALNSRFKQKSNIYSVAGVAFKLSLLAKTDFNNYFGERIDRNPDIVKLYIDKFNQQDLTAKEGKEKITIRDVLGFIEHERWNAFEIAYGVLPMKISKAEELSAKSGKLVNQIELLYHLCICTQNGLRDYYNKFSTIPEYSSGANVLKYDYDFMDYYFMNQKQIDKIMSSIMEKPAKTIRGKINAN